MAVQRTLRILQLVTRASGATGGTCSGPTVPPPCPPCTPHRPPPCRSQEQRPPQGVRIVCCPPRPPKPLPCPPASCTLTCSDVSRQKNNCLQTDESLNKSCGIDYVAWRLACAKRTRQLDYEREVSASKKDRSKCYKPPPAPYTLGGERELARATDGNLYAITRPIGPQAHCSSTEEPPSPRRVSLAESNRNCHIGSDNLDPCAHQPRVFLEIDRCSKETSHEDGSGTSNTCVDKPHGGGTGSGAGGIGDIGWCKSPPSFPGAPKRCRPLTIVERLRARPSRLATRDPHKDGTRRLHTSVIATSTAGGLQELLKSKERLKEGGQGRVVMRNCSPQQKRPKPPDGHLDLCVQPCTSRVRVHVYLDGGDCNICDKPKDRTSNQKPHAVCQTNNFTSQCKGSESWLSMKKIQKTLAGKPDSKVSSSPKEKPPPSTPACPRPSCPECAPGSSNSKAHLPRGPHTRGIS
ncbi:unnamed protein product [Arctia plantaginis]|uniref:Uncharacterized protein n=1 Tax=Arctia plantaginis TaxID=874455 RepID=A0A8S0ZGG2_ARCPL|nr:unnamed protein product [Arctia plantaginis]